MIAIDTNVLVRLLARDDPAQLSAARALLAQEQVLVTLCCLLETGWVLQSRFGLDGAGVRKAVSSLFAIRNLVFEDREWLDWMLDRCAAGADWGDVVLLVAARHEEAFATFDRQLSRKAGKGAPVPVRLLS